MNDEEGSKFEYIKRFRTTNGRLTYECKCAMCGNICYYHRMTKDEPVCHFCVVTRQNSRQAKRRKQNIENAKNDAILNLEKELINLMPDKENIILQATAKFK